MLKNLKVIKRDSKFASEVRSLAAGGNTAPVLGKIVDKDGEIPSIKKFIDLTFPGLQPEDIYGELRLRGDGVGPHFDVYDGILRSNYPWVGVYNLAGQAVLYSGVLGDDLYEAYQNRYQAEADSDAAQAARGLFATIELGLPNSAKYRGVIEPGSAIVIPQNSNGEQIVHDVVPDKYDNTGRYLKLFAPRATSIGIIDDYLPLNELLEELYLDNAGQL